MVLFYGYGSTVSRLQRHYEGTVYFYPLSLEEYHLSTSEGEKTESTLGDPVVLNMTALDWESSAPMRTTAID